MKEQIIKEMEQEIEERDKIIDKLENWYFEERKHNEYLSEELKEKEKQLALIEKVLELACMEFYCELENPDNELYDKSPDQYINYFKTKAKEMMKSE